jgi:hypothetical protein
MSASAVRLVVVVAVAAALMAGCTKQVRPETERIGLSEVQDASAFPDARAVILLDRTEVTIAAGSEGARPVAEIIHTRRVQVLTEAGRELARVLLPFDERTRIFSVTGRVKKPDGRTIEMNDAAVLDVDRFTQDQPAAKLYDGPGYKLARVPEVEVNDIFEVTVVSRVRDPRWLPPVTVGGDLPFVRGEVVFDVQQLLDVDLRVTKNGRIASDKPTRIPTTLKLLTEAEPLPESMSRGTRFAWVFERTPAVFPEGAGAAPEALATQVHAVLRSGSDAFRSIDDVAAWYRELTRGMVEDKASAAEIGKLAKGFKGGKTDKVRQIQRYVQDDVKDAPTFINLAALRPRTPGDVIRFGVGDAKDQASLTIALLRAAGLDGLPLLVSREGSFASVPDLPTPAPFNHVVVAVPAGGSFSYIDPSTPGLPTGKLPAVLQGAVGILVTPDGGELVTLPEDPPEANVADVRYDLKLGADGTITGQLRGTFSGIEAARAQRVLELEEGAQAQALTTMLFGETAGDPAAKRGLAIGDVFRTASRSGDAKGRDEAIKLQSRLSPLRTRDVVVMDDIIGRPLAFLWREGRKSPVFFGARGTTVVRVDVALPPGKGIEALPVSIDKPGPLVNVQERWSVADGVLTFIRTVQTVERVVPADRYDELRAAITASWARSQQPVRIIAGGDRGASYGGDAF